MVAGSDQTREWYDPSLKFAASFQPEQVKRLHENKGKDEDSKHLKEGNGVDDPKDLFDEPDVHSDHEVPEDPEVIETKTVTEE